MGCRNEIEVIGVVSDGGHLAGDKRHLGGLEISLRVALGTDNLRGDEIAVAVGTSTPPAPAGIAGKNPPRMVPQ